MTEKRTPTPQEYIDFVGALFFRNKGDLSKDFAHAVIGVWEESGEVEGAYGFTEVVEELGDLLFFVTAAEIVLNDLMDGEGLYQPLRHAVWDILGNEEQQERWLYESSRLALGSLPVPSIEAVMGAAKKWVGYGSCPKLDSVYGMQAAMHRTLRDAANEARKGSDMSPVAMLQAALSANMDKLNYRYKQGFSRHAAENRDLEGERRVLDAATAQR